MTDTSSEMRKKHYEIILSKTPAERIEMAVQMMEDVRQIALNGIRLKNPGISEGDLLAEFVKLYYKNDFSKEYLDDVMKSIKEWHKSKHP